MGDSLSQSFTNVQGTKQLEQVKSSNAIVCKQKLGMNQQDPASLAFLMQVSKDRYFLVCEKEENIESRRNHTIVSNLYHSYFVKSPQDQDRLPFFNFCSPQDCGEGISFSLVDERPKVQVTARLRLDNSAKPKDFFRFTISCIESSCIRSRVDCLLPKVNANQKLDKKVRPLQVGKKQKPPSNDYAKELLELAMNGSKTALFRLYEYRDVYQLTKKDENASAASIKLAQAMIETRCLPFHLERESYN